MLLRSYYGPGGSAHWKHTAVFKKKARIKNHRGNSKAEIKTGGKVGDFEASLLHESGATGMQENDLLFTSVFGLPLFLFFSLIHFDTFSV